MSVIVKVERNGQLTIPIRLRSQVGLAEGDLVEAKAHNEKIVLTPRSRIHRDDSPAQRRVINARLARAETDIKAGRVSNPFSDHNHFIVSLHNAVAKLSSRKSKRPVR